MATWSAIVAVTTIVAGGCAGRAIPQPFPSPSVSTGNVGGLDRADGRTSEIIDTALQFRGVPYRNGGADPSGFDCSGLTQYVFSLHQIRLPREVREQFATGIPVNVDSIARGDLLFFSTTDPGPSHVGIAIDADRFVHAPSSNGVVRVDRRLSSYWTARFVGARRITPP